jgi:hypothetical protein
MKARRGRQETAEQRLERLKRQGGGFFPLPHNDPPLKHRRAPGALATKKKRGSDMSRLFERWDRLPDERD